MGAKKLTHKLVGSLACHANNIDVMDAVLKDKADSSLIMYFPKLEHVT